MSSWIIRVKTTGKPVRETFNAKVAEYTNADAGEYEAVPALQHLQEINTPGTPAHAWARREEL